MRNWIARTHNALGSMFFAGAIVAVALFAAGCTSTTELGGGDADTGQSDDEVADTYEPDPSQDSGTVDTTTEPEDTGSPDTGSPGVDGGDGDGGAEAPPERPEDWPTTLEAQHVDDTPAVDGQLDDAAWDEATAVTFADRSETSDDIVTARALWTEQNLYLSYDVWDPEVVEQEAGELWEADGAEFYLDTADDDAGSLQGDDYHVIRSVDGRTLVERGRHNDVADQVALEHAVETTSRGYRVEFAVPWSDIATDVSYRRTLGLLLVGNDRESDGSSRQFPWKEASPFATPSAWGTLELVGGPPKEEPEAPEDAIKLCDQGLSDGDAINSYISNHVTDGATVLVCRGTYSLSNLSISADDWTLIAPQGATLDISGTTHITLDGSGYRFSGFVYDQTGSNDVMHMNIQGTNWKVDHLAWDGQSAGGTYQITPRVEAENATGVIDTIYMGDGQVPRTAKGGIWVAYQGRGHRGTLTIRRAYVAHMVDNGIYATSPPNQGLPGRTNIEDSYLWSNTITNARTGALNGQETHVTGSVIVADDTSPPCGVGCSSPGASPSRAVWAWYGPVRVENNHFCIQNNAKFVTKNGGTILDSNNTDNCPSNLNPPQNPSPPQGVPTTAQSIYQNPPGLPSP